MTDENEKNQSDLENMTAQVNQANEKLSKKEAEAEKAKADADKAKSELETHPTHKVYHVKAWYLLQDKLIYIWRNKTAK